MFSVGAHSGTMFYVLTYLADKIERVNVAHEVPSRSAMLVVAVTETSWGFP